MQTAGGHWGILADGRTPRPFFASDSRLDHFSYGPQHAQPEPQHFSRQNCHQGRRSSRKDRREKTVARRRRLGGILAAQNDRGRKDWAASFHYLSRKFDGHGYGSLPANHA